MSKVIFSIVVILTLSILLGLIMPKTVYAAPSDKVGFGPFQINDYINGIEVVVETLENSREYVFRSDTASGCPPRAAAGPCIGVQNLDAVNPTDPSSRTTIRIKSVRGFIIQGGSTIGDDRTIFEPTGLSEWNLAPGQETGWITYRVSTRFAYPQIVIDPREITRSQTTTVTIVFPDPKAPAYSIVLSNPLVLPGAGITLASIDCSRLPCTTGAGTFSNNILTLDIAGNNLVENATYRVQVSFLGNDSDISDTFVVRGPTGSLNISLDPNSLRESKTKNRSIRVTLINGTTTDYRITLQGKADLTFGCAGPNCYKDIPLGRDGLRAGVYIVTASSVSTPSLNGSATLNITRDTPLPTGTTSGLPTGPTGTGPAPTGFPAKAGGDPCDTDGFKTAIGCIHTSPVALVNDFLKFGLGIGGGLAFLMMLLGAFQMLTSAGNPETLATGRDRLTNAVIGLLFVIFAVLLLQIIGIGILNIPGFGR